MTKTFAELENERAALQEQCDSAKTQEDRNRLGQFATPTPLARQIMEFAKKWFPLGEKVRFLDPAFGTGAFYSALHQTFPQTQIEAATGFEVDSHYANETLRLWRGSGLDLRVADFTKASPPEPSEQFNLVVCNPPYVRHHHLTVGEKGRLRRLAYRLSGFSLSGLSGLYGYFLLLADAWAGNGSICIWLIPSEFMDVNYGVSLKEYLLTKVTLLQIHRFHAKDVQFGDALVSSSVVCFRKALPPNAHAVDFTFGGALAEPEARQRIPLSDLRASSKWNVRSVRNDVNVPRAKLSDIFDIRRGLATGDNGFFILTRQKIRDHHLPMKFFKPILPSPRYLPADEIQADEDGNPLLERQLFLLDCRLPVEELQSEYPSLWQYLHAGENEVAKGYLCRSRSPWYSQEKRPAPLFLCTYMGRINRKNGAAFRFIFNRSKATAANVYLLLYPKSELTRCLHASPELARRVWGWLNAISPDVVSGEGRVYGGGLHKLEPRELGNIPADGLADLLSIPIKKKPTQLDFLSAYHESRVIHP